MSSIVGYVIATRNRASGVLAIDWDMDIHSIEGAREELAAARAAGERAAILRLTMEVADDECTPWSPAPWRATPSLYGQNRIVDANGKYIARVGPTLDVDAELIALAPRMAEAIMRADFACYCGVGNPCPEPLVHDVAAELRAIGERDE